MSWVDQWRAALVVGFVFTFAAGLAAGVGYTAWHYPDRPRRPGDTQPVNFTVTRGMTPAIIARALAERGVLDHPQWFGFYATERGDASRVRAGRYHFSAGMTPRQVMDALIAGVADEEVDVTIPEGKNLREVAAILEEAGVCPAADLVAAARDATVLRQLGLSAESAEGWLYPDKYRFRPGTSATKVVLRLGGAARLKLAELKDLHRAGLAALRKGYDFDDQQIVLMASLVEKETARPEERPLIAGVFLNRLRLPTFKPHLLQTDPTIVYGCTVPESRSAACRKWDGRIHRIHLDDVDNPYNTYTHEGLPPGPICSPGRAALEAVLAPDTTTYLFFVSRNDGTHQFSRTRAEHEAAVDRYQRARGGGG